MRAGVLGLGIDLDAEAFLQRQPQLEGVHRVQAEALAEQAEVGGDVFGRHVFEAEGVDDQVLNLVLQIAHLRRAP
ncbi:hypothetical protein D3C84_1234330 [compost metagenome]